MLEEDSSQLKSAFTDSVSSLLRAKQIGLVTEELIATGGKDLEALLSDESKQTTIELARKVSRN